MKRFWLFQDWAANASNPKGRLVMVLFRAAQASRRAPRPLALLLVPYLIFYRIFVEWVLGIELPWNATVGPGLVIYHGQSLVVNDHAVIGAGCVLRNSVTIGNKRNRDGTYSAAPQLGDNVDVGANATIIGPITIGTNVVVGAGAVVVKDVPSDSVVAGNPARLVRSLSQSERAG